MFNNKSAVSIKIIGIVLIFFIGGISLFIGSAVDYISMDGIAGEDAIALFALKHSSYKQTFYLTRSADLIFNKLLDPNVEDKTHRFRVFLGDNGLSLLSEDNCDALNLCDFKEFIIAEDLGIFLKDSMKLIKNNELAWLNNDFKIDFSKYLTKYNTFNDGHNLTKINISYENYELYFDYDSNKISGFSRRQLKVEDELGNSYYFYPHFTVTLINSLEEFYNLDDFREARVNLDKCLVNHELFECSESLDEVYDVVIQNDGEKSFVILSDNNLKVLSRFELIKRDR